MLTRASPDKGEPPLWRKNPVEWAGNLAKLVFYTTRLALMLIGISEK